MDDSHQFLDHALNAVDSKGRVSVPATFRAKLTARLTDPTADISLHIGLSPTGDYLTAMDPAGVAKARADVEEALAAVPPADRPAARKRALRDALGPTDLFKFDSNGRIVLSPMLRELAGIDGLAFFLGVGDSIEIWAPDKALKAMEDGPVAPTLRWLLKDRGVAL